MICRRSIIERAWNNVRPNQELRQEPDRNSSAVMGFFRTKQTLVEGNASQGGGGVEMSISDLVVQAEEDIEMFGSGGNNKKSFDAPRASSEGDNSSLSQPSFTTSTSPTATPLTAASSTAENI